MLLPSFINVAWRSNHDIIPLPFLEYSSCLIHTRRRIRKRRPLSLNPLQEPCLRTVRKCSAQKYSPQPSRHVGRYQSRDPAYKVLSQDLAEHATALESR